MSVALEVPADLALVRVLASRDEGRLVRAAATEDLPLVSAVFLAEVDAASLSASDRVDLVRAWERLSAAIAGHQQLALASLVDATEAIGLEADAARHEVGAALRLAPSTARLRTRVAADLRDRLPDVLAALLAGTISYSQAAHIAEAVRDLDDVLALQVAARVLRRAGVQTLGQLKRATRRAVIAADPAAARARHEHAKARRAISRVPQPDAMRAWWVMMPAPVEVDLWSALTSAARVGQAALAALGRPDPGLDALRVDALVGAVLGPEHTSWWDASAAHATPPGSSSSQAAEPATSRGAGSATQPRTAGSATRDPTSSPSGSASSTTHRSTAQVAALPRCSCGGAQVAAIVVDLPTVLGLADNPAHIPGYGAIPGELGAAMARDRDWIRWTVDPGTGQVVDRGARSYRPSQRMKAFLAARDGVCGFPGCAVLAQSCDCDHVVTFRRDGRTVRDNLGPLCRQHHNAKTHGRWRLSRDADGGIKTWTSPLGRTYLKGTDPPLC